MRIHSFTPPGTLQTSRLALPPDESHHLARVLRAQPGQPITLFDGQGSLAEGLIEEVSKKEVTVRILSCQTVAPPRVDITLIQALPKPDRFEMILQKATELGIRHIQPVASAHAVLRSKEPEKQRERWQTILRNAAQQCNAAWLPMIQEIKKLEPLLPALRTFDVTFIGSLHPSAQPFRQAFQSLEKSTVKTAALLIGPEGDWTADETADAVAAGAIPVTFGPQILRTETAALFGLSILTYELF
jgi:16S rRNA (uracil1498-N3)-methyltransferase